MPEAKFVLKEPNADDKTLVFLLYRFGNQRLKCSTGEKINPKYWNSKKQRAREANAFAEYAQFNHRLQKIETAINNAYRKLLNEEEKEIYPELLKKALDKELNPKAIEKKLPFIDWLRNEIELSKIDRKEGTIKVYNTLVNKLVEFETKKKFRLSFETIDLEFYNQFQDYLLNDMKLTTNYFGKIIRTLKKFLNLATDKGINTNIKYKTRDFKSMQEVVNHVYLSETELDSIYKLDLSLKPSLERVRDLFIIGCYTGLRFSDFTQLKSENLQKVNDTEVFTVITQKTNEKVVIPIHNRVREIWKKYKGELPRAISNQKMNIYIKEVAELAELTENTIIRKTGGKNIKNYENPKYKFVSTHTARRSFATNAFLAKVPTISIMKITGHRTESSFLKYIKVSAEENAENLSLHPFFNS